MTRRKVPKPPKPPEPPTFDDEPTSESLLPGEQALPFSEPGVRVHGDEPTEWDKAEADWQAAKGTEPRDAFAKAALDEPPFTMTATQPVRVESLGSFGASVVIGEADRICDAAAALVDEYVARCVSGESVGLPELRELRKRVAAL